MAKQRGRNHTTLTETSKEVVKVLKKIPSIKMIAPGIIDPKNSGSKRHVTIVYTNAGCELIITGQGAQNVAVHTDDPMIIKKVLTDAKNLKHFSIKERERRPDV
tara:strand:+ start:818 stop:1129 length:312 start_codon:yes stop_codon:yes gene_type:complete